jgi:hypothetical protein
MECRATYWPSVQCKPPLVLDDAGASIRHKAECDLHLTATYFARWICPEDIAAAFCPLA